MTTFPLGPENDELADALQLVVAHLEQKRNFAARYVAGLRDAARPGNGWGGPGELPWAERPKVAAAAREVAAAHPEHAERLVGLALGIDASLAQARANGIRV
jgi:hypothetical protein